MLIEEKFVVKAAPQQVWDFVLDPEKLSSCVPGCEKMELIGENTYLSVVKAKVGSVSVRFSFTTTLTEVEPLRHLNMSGSGEDLNKAGVFSQETVVDLKEISAGETEVSYRSDLNIGGKLATFGDRVMRAKAKEVGEEFARALTAKLSGNSGDSGNEVKAPPELKMSTWEVVVASLSVLGVKMKELWEKIISPLKSGSS